MPPLMFFMGELACILCFFCFELSKYNSGRYSVLSKFVKLDIRAVTLAQTKTIITLPFT